jgi:FkbM family methyltransferase
MRDYVVQGVKLRLPDALLTPHLLRAFERGWYEKTEADQLAKFLRDGDRILELGGGVGFLSSYASKLKQIANCVVVEANPDLIQVIRETHSLNGASAKVMNAVAASRRSRLALSVNDAGEVPFYQRENFWGSSLSNAWSYRAIALVKVIDFQALIDEASPTCIIMDIEGGEAEIFHGVDLSIVRHVLVEVHKSELGLKGIHAIIDTLAREGLYLDPEGTSGAVFLFTRAA